MARIQQNFPRPATALPIRETPQPTKAPTMTSAPAPSKHSIAFNIADMQGRDPRKNRVCATCISKLSPEQVSQINWHIADGQSCKLCDIMSYKPEAFTQPFMDFIDENPTVFHAVDYFKRKLHDTEFQEVS